MADFDNLNGKLELLTFNNELWNLKEVEQVAMSNCENNSDC